MNLKLNQVPESGPLMLKAVKTIRRRPPADIVLPEMSVDIPSFRFDANNLSQYREICGFPAEGGIPMPYPQVSAISLQMYLMTQPQFPLPLLGLVHLRNVIEQERELGADETFAVQVMVAEHRATSKGLEFDVETRYTDDQGKVPWSSTATVLFRRKSKSGGSRRPPPQAPEGMGSYQTIDAPADIGRRYGKIAGDQNPIHLYPITAKLFGFKQHIAHGMWTMARSCALLQPKLGGAPKRLEVKFIQPLFLPGRASLRHDAEGDGFSFKLLSRDGDKTHLIGTLS